MQLDYDINTKYKSHVNQKNDRMCHFGLEKKVSFVEIVLISLSEKF